VSPRDVPTVRACLVRRLRLACRAGPPERPGRRTLPVWAGLPQRERGPRRGRSAGPVFGSARKSPVTMGSWIELAAFLVAWILLQYWILPKLGIGT
jgi:hypothetical protein